MKLLSLVCGTAHLMFEEYVSVWHIDQSRIRLSEGETEEKMTWWCWEIPQIVGLLQQANSDCHLNKFSSSTFRIRTKVFVLLDPHTRTLTRIVIALCRRNVSVNNPKTRNEKKNNSNKRNGKIYIYLSRISFALHAKIIIVIIIMYLFIIEKSLCSIDFYRVPNFKSHSESVISRFVRVFITSLIATHPLSQLPQSSRLRVRVWSVWNQDNPKCITLNRNRIIN